MGSCQIQRVQSDSIFSKDSSSKFIQSKSSIIPNQIVQSSNPENKLEFDQRIEDEENLLTVQSRIKKDKRLYNFQEEESHKIIRDNDEQLKLATKQKRHLYRTSLTHSHFDEIKQNSPTLNHSLQADGENEVKSVKSILKKKCKLQDSVSGSPETRSVRFARGTIFRTKSQRSLRHQKCQKKNQLQKRQNESIKFIQNRSPNWKRHREEERVQMINIFGLFSLNQNIGVKTQLFPYY